MRRWISLALALVLAAPAAAEGPERRRLDDMEAVGFRAVGRLNIAGGRFCTATLVTERLVLTAAHCLFDPDDGRRVGPGELSFLAGKRRNDARAVRGVVRAAVLPEFRFEGRAEWRRLRHDLALVELDAAIPAALALPLAVDRPPGGAVAIVSYARDRPRVASIQEVCPVLVTLQGVAVLRCAIEFGASGAPVIAVSDGRLRLVAVASAMGRDLTGGSVALSVVAAPRLDELRAALAQAPRRP